MKRAIILFIMGLLSVPVYCQVWIYRAGYDTIDGNYKTSNVQGVGIEWPYTKPLFIINIFSNNVSSTHLYFTKVPCACCANLRVMIRFDDEERRHNFRASTNANEDVWFLEFKKESVRWDGGINEWIDYATDEDDVDKFNNFIKDLKTHTKMYVRLRDDCRSYYCEFSLKGSAAALNFVFK